MGVGQNSRQSLTRTFQGLGQSAHGFPKFQIRQDHWSLQLSCSPVQEPSRGSKQYPLQIPARRPNKKSQLAGSGFLRLSFAWPIYLAEAFCLASFGFLRCLVFVLGRVITLEPGHSALANQLQMEVKQAPTTGVCVCVCLFLRVGILFSWLNRQPKGTSASISGSPCLDTYPKPWVNYKAYRAKQTNTREGSVLGFLIWVCRKIGGLPKACFFAMVSL